jgi:hypothetical protein
MATTSSRPESSESESESERANQQLFDVWAARGRSPRVSSFLFTGIIPGSRYCFYTLPGTWYVFMATQPISIEKQYIGFPKDESERQKFRFYYSFIAQYKDCDRSFLVYPLFGRFLSRICSKRDESTSNDFRELVNVL